MNRRLFLLTAGLCIASSACASDASYIFSPVEPSTVRLGNFTAARHPLPPEAPVGELLVTSFGLVESQDEDGSAALHVRLVASNTTSDAPMTLDTRDVMVEIAGEGTSRAMAVSAERDGLPSVVIPRGERRTIDFYYPLPEGVEEEADLAAFDVAWRVRIGERDIAGRTAFGRMAVVSEPEPTRTVYVNNVVWGPVWWYDTGFPRYTFVRVHPWYVVRPVRRVYVVPARRAPVRVHRHRVYRAPRR
jgi:hypothetical protein